MVRKEMRKYRIKKKNQPDQSGGIYNFEDPPVKMSKLPSVPFLKILSRKEFTLSVFKHLMEIPHLFGLKKKDLMLSYKVSQ